MFFSLVADCALRGRGDGSRLHAAMTEEPRQTRGLRAHDGQRADEAIRWDAAAEIAVGEFIRQYLREHPAPPGSATAHDLQCWASALARGGQARREAVGEGRRLRSVA